MNYLAFDIEDFIMDDFFQKWVKTPDEQTEAFWRQWLLEHPEKKAVVAQASKFIQKIDFNEKWTATERSEIWHNIAINLENEAIENTNTNIKPFKNYWNWLAIACSLVMITAVSLYFYRFRTQEVTTSFGEIKQITLNDGSVVTLNANSSIVYKNGMYANSNREVWVEGDVIFEVSKQVDNGNKLPFIVHAENLNVEVLGTIFSVSNRRHEKNIVLQEGSVKVTDEKDVANTVLLRPNESVSQSKTALVKQEVDALYATAWKNKVMLFKQKSLVEIAQMMKDLYNIDMVIDNPALKNETFTGSFPTDSVDIFFVKLQKLYPVQITKNGNSIHLK